MVDREGVGSLMSFPVHKSFLSLSSSDNVTLIVLIQDLGTGLKLVAGRYSRNRYVFFYILPLAEGLYPCLSGTGFSLLLSQWLTAFAIY